MARYSSRRCVASMCLVARIGTARALAPGAPAARLEAARFCWRTVKGGSVNSQGAGGASSQMLRTASPTGSLCSAICRRCRSQQGRRAGRAGFTPVDRLSCASSNSRRSSSMSSSVMASLLGPAALGRQSDKVCLLCHAAADADQRLFDRAIVGCSTSKVTGMSGLRPM